MLRAAGKLRLLRALNVRNNRLEFLPHELSSIPSLKNLCYSGNQMNGPPEGSMLRLEDLFDLRPRVRVEPPRPGEEPPIPWAEELLSAGMAVEALIIYLRNYLVARGSITLSIKATLDLDLRYLGLVAVPEEVQPNLLYYSQA